MGHNDLVVRLRALGAPPTGAPRDRRAAARLLQALFYCEFTLAAAAFRDQGWDAQARESPTDVALRVGSASVWLRRYTDDEGIDWSFLGFEPSVIPDGAERWWGVRAITPTEATDAVRSVVDRLLALFRHNYAQKRRSRAVQRVRRDREELRDAGLTRSALRARWRSGQTPVP